MVVPVLAYWGYAILAAGGAMVSAYVIKKANEAGKIELPDSIGKIFEPKPEPEQRPPNRPNNMALRTAMETMIATETRLKQRCDDNEQQDCPYCKPAVDGRSVWDNFDGGPVIKPSPKARGSLYQHYVVPWFQYKSSEDAGGRLYIQIEEWAWKRNGSWDGLDHNQCRLYECKLGYRDFLDENKLDRALSYTQPNPKKRWLGSIKEAFEDQLFSQHAAIIDDWPKVTLEWVFSDEEVMWQFVKMRGDYHIDEIDNRHAPFELAPSGKQFVRELYASGEEDYGYWEDG